MSVSPTELKPWHDQAALLMALGLFTDAEIAAKVNCAPNSLWSLKQSVAFEEAVARYRQQITGSTIERAVTAIMADAEANVEFLRSMRGTQPDTADHQRGRNQIAATKLLLDRQVPSVRQTTVQNTHTVEFDAETLARLAGIAKDITPATPPVRVIPFAEYEAIPVESPQDPDDAG